LVNEYFAFYLVFQFVETTASKIVVVPSSEEQCMKENIPLGHLGGLLKGIDHFISRLDV
jgi:hypothetical protein